MPDELFCLDTFLAKSKRPYKDTKKQINLNDTQTTQTIYQFL